MANLKGTRGLILKIRSRDRSGRNIHKAQFSVDDKKAVERELRVWKDKLGVPLESFRNIVKEPIDQEEIENMREMMKKSISDGDKNIKKVLA